jgi:hypothetical protein
MKICPVVKVIRGRDTQPGKCHIPAFPYKMKSRLKNYNVIPLKQILEIPKGSLLE